MIEDMTNLFEDSEFDGPEYKPEHDQKRLTGQILRVFSFMKDGNWHTLDVFYLFFKLSSPGVQFL